MNIPALSVRRWLKAAHPDVVNILRLLSWEFGLLRVRVSSRLSPKQVSIRRRLNRANDLKVHLGCGRNRVAGWVNLDATAHADLRVDLRSSIPLASGSTKFIFTEHFLDHIDHPRSVAFLLRECHRILQPGGTMRIIVHDGELLMRAYAANDLAFFRRVVRVSSFRLTDDSLPLEIINEIFRFEGAHRFIYDFATLKKELLAAGFSLVQRSSFRASRAPECNLDLDLPDREIQSLYIDAAR